MLTVNQLTCVRWFRRWITQYLQENTNSNFLLNFYVLSLRVHIHVCFYMRVVICALIQNSKLAVFLTRISALSAPVGMITRVNFSTNSHSNSQQEKLLVSKKEDFNHQLEALAEPLGHLFDKTSSKYKGIIYQQPFKFINTNSNSLIIGTILFKHCCLQISQRMLKSSTLIA